MLTNFYVTQQNFKYPSMQWLPAPPPHSVTGSLSLFGGQGLGVEFDLFSWVVKLSECSLWKLNPCPPLPYSDFCLPPLPTPASD